ncbi:MAG: hypothetical protein QM780_05130 [Hyphomicrobium sp.]|uniref:hypothetical protein n=1 Tax=Hyphomicrobium sp. TaxID=82 RepID=UPI0039E59489
MTPQQLIRKIKALPERAPHTEALERWLRRGPVWYSSQKEHWLGWLSHYGGPGAYGRKVFDHDAAFAYNHCGCPPMALWLGEASGVDQEIVRRAGRAAVKMNGTFSAKCGIIRHHVPWHEIEARLLGH